MMEEYQIDELYERCIELELERYTLIDKIDDILDCLITTHITIEEMEKLEELINEQSMVDR